ncbi:MAG: hypothetical protein LUD14_12105 [Clostridiales bacterium]|nr:hypothetical protein [Clostridiales bacterium]
MARKSSDVIRAGDRFGHLTVVCDSGKRKNRYIVWKCRCDCGNELEIDMRTLKRGTMQDCGCITKVGPRQKDITGQRFGMLTAVSCTGRHTGNGDYIWHCVCDCGGEIDASLHQLRAGYRKSCGCLSHPPLKDFIGRRFGRLTVVAYSGKEDGMHRWKCKCDCGNEIIIGQSPLQNGKTRSCGCLKAETMRENAKLVAGTSVTFLENNRAHLRVNNTSGHTGVYLQKTTGRWVARIGFRGKSYYLGTYDKLEDAVKARERGEEMHTDFLDWYYNEYLQEKEEAKEPAVEETAAEADGSEAEESAGSLETKDLMVEETDVNQKDSVLEDIAVDQKAPMLVDIVVNQKSPVAAGTVESQETKDFALEESTENTKTMNVIPAEKTADTSSKDSIPAEDENAPAKKPVLLIKKTQGRKELA